MANPLARVVMNNEAQKSGMVRKRSSRANNAGRSANLGTKEKQLLSSLLNDKSSRTTDRSYDKSTYGRSSSSSNNKASKTMQTLSSLAPQSSNKAQKSVEKKECVIDRSRASLKQLCTLDNISLGKPNTASNKTTENRKTSTNRNTINKLNLDELARGKGASNTVNKKANTSTNQSSSGMVTLDQLTKQKTKNKKTDKVNNQQPNKNNSNVRSSVINNLGTYIPKVSLESIGKKGSIL